jgi:nucleoid DNA-binding protein
MKDGYVDCCKEDFASMATPKKKTEGSDATGTGSTTLGRQELSRRIAQQADISQKQAQAALEATLKSIREALQSGNEVRLVGFGSFKVRRSAARKGVNPRDRQPIEVPAKERVRFTPGKELADAVVKK